MRSVARLSIRIILAFVFAGPALAQDPRTGPWERFSISVGGFITESDTTVQINSNTLGVGAVLDLENVLGVERSFQTYRIDAKYRIGQTRRHEIELHYFNSQRDGNKALEQDIQIGDQIFTVGTSVSTEWELQSLNIDYVYNFLMDERVRLGLAAGVHTTGIRLKVAENTRNRVEQEEFTAPLPMFGFRSEVILARNWRLRTDLSVFYLEYDQFTGRLADGFIGIEWNPWKNFGFGAGANAVRYSVEADGEDLANFSGEIEYNLTGLLLYGRYFF